MSTDHVITFDQLQDLLSNVPQMYPMDDEWEEPLPGYRNTLAYGVAALGKALDCTVCQGNFNVDELRSALDQYATGDYSEDDDDSEFEPVESIRLEQLQELLQDIDPGLEGTEDTFAHGVSHMVAALEATVCKGNFCVDDLRIEIGFCITAEDMTDEYIAEARA